MEVCGGQTHSIIRHGIDQLLPNEVELIHGPGCPVCVTPLEMIDRALAIEPTANGINFYKATTLAVSGRRDAAIQQPGNVPVRRRIGEVVDHLARYLATHRA